MDCLNNIVGISDSTSEAILGGLTTEQRDAVKLSVSGLYLDDLPGGLHFKALKYVDASKGFFEMATDAINNATRTLEDDLIVALNENYGKARKNFKGTIGQNAFAQTLSTSGNLQGLRLRATDYRQAVIYLSRFLIVTNTSATFSVRFYKAYQGAEETHGLVASYPVVVSANNFTTIDTLTAGKPLKLPLTEDGQALEYWIIYDRTEAGGGSPKDARIQCSTCNKAGGLHEYLKVNGVGFNSLTDLKSALADDYNHGLTLEVEIKCNTTDIFCSEYKNTEAVAVVMAHAVRWKAGELLIEDVLKSPDVNRYTTMAREYLWGKRNHFRKEYENRVVYLADTIDVTDSNCFVCREKPGQPFFAGIMA